MSAADRYRVIGECYYCHQPVRARFAAHVQDLAVSLAQGRPVSRLAHLGECAASLRNRLGQDLRA